MDVLLADRQNPYVITIRFDGVEDLQLDDFNHQNVIQELVRTQEESRLKVQMPSLFGADLSLTCSEAEVVGIKSTNMLTGHPLDARGQPDSGGL